MATRVKIKGLKSAVRLSNRKALKIAKDALVDPKLATRFKNIIINQIRKDGKLPDGTSIKPVSRKWKQRRNRLAEYNKTSRHYTPGASKLTFTGRFLSSFKANVLKSGLFGRVTYEIGPTGKHKPYETSPKIHRGTGRFKSSSAQKKVSRENALDNATIGEGQIKQGRDYTKLGEDIKIELRKAAIGRIRRAIKLYLGKQGSK